VVLSGGKAIVTGLDLFAFDTTTGRASWTYAAADHDDVGYSSIVADDTTVFAPSRTARLYALDSRTGTARWIVDLREGGTDVGAFNPTLADGTVYVCTLTYTGPLRGKLWAIDARTGAVRWRHAFTPELPQQGSRCFGHTAVWQDLVIQPQEDGRVFAFERATGAVRWIAPRVHVTRSLGDRGYATAGASIVIVTSQANEGMLVAYDPATGTERWRYKSNSGSMFPAVIHGDVAYVDHGWIFASYEANTGALRWQMPLTVLDPETPFKGRPIVAGDRLYVAGRDGSYALKP
jgi:outer membrane protein assembly factor BamB